MSNERKLALTLASEQMKREDFLKEHAASMNADQLYDAVLKATGSKRQAEAEMMARLKANLKNNRPPE